MSVELPTYIPLGEAAAKYRLDRQSLTQAIEDGIIRAVRINGGVAVANEDVAVVNKRNSLWKRVKHLDGNPISMSEACERYPEINFASLSRWVQQGHIRTISGQRGGGRGRKLLLNEADVAYTASLVQIRGKKPGKRVFTPEYLPPHQLHAIAVV